MLFAAAAADATAGGCCWCTAAVCTGIPSPVLNGAFPSSCSGSALGSGCLAVCDPGFEAGLEPLSMCVLDGAKQAVWGPPDPTLCMKGTVKNGIAFILNQDANVVRSALSNRTFNHLAAFTHYNQTR